MNNMNIEPISYIRKMNHLDRRCLQKLINICMVDGKKNKAYSIVMATLYRLADYGDVIDFVVKAIENVKPVLEVRRVRISGSTQHVPSLISRQRQETLAIRWILDAAIKRRSTKKNIKLDQCLSAEFIDAFNKVGAVRKKRDELHKLAEANRGFSHYRWW